DDEAGRGRRGDGDVRLRAGDRGGDGVGGRQAPGAGRLERGAEGVDAGVGGDERVVGRQGGLRVRAAEADRAGVAGGGVAEGVAGGHRDVVGHAGRGRRRVAADHERTRRGRVDGDARLRAGDVGRQRVRGGDGPAAGGLER